MVICVVTRCSSILKYNSNNNNEESLRFFSIPEGKDCKTECNFTRDRSVRRRSLWLTRINRDDFLDENVKYSTMVCSRHFISGEPAPAYDESNPDWAPSLNMGYDIPSNVDKCSDREPSDQEGTAKRLRIASSDEYFQTKSDAAFVVDLKEYDIFPDHSSASIEDMNTVEQSCSVKFEPLDQFDSSCTSSEAANLINNYDTLKKEYSELVVKYTSLRSQLAEADCNNLELRKDCAEKEVACESYKEQNKILEESNVLLCEALNQYEKVNEELNEQMQVLKNKVSDTQGKLENSAQSTLVLKDLKTDSKKIQFYTGLPNFAMFETVLTSVSPLIKETFTAPLAPWQSLLLTLMRLKLALTLQDLAFRFNISASTASVTFERWLYALYVCLKSLINWPDRDALYKTMPNSFKDAFGPSVAIIVDCFEILAGRPDTLDVRGMTCLNYKHHNTVKFIIGITPHGTISFISKGWGSRVSDKHLAANSGLYEKLLPGDVVMSDCGFLVSEDLGFHCAKLVMTKGQFSASDITYDTDKIFALRIQVERVIGLVRRKYSILLSTVPVTLLSKKPGHDVSQIDQIVHVCCALTNLSSGIT